MGLAAALAACQGGSSATALLSNDTGLDGMALRGPVTPVCQENVPCDGPLAGDFLVIQGDRVVARFSSDATGHFRVALAAGDYAIAPAPGAPVMPGQRQDVSVPASGYQNITLAFDTGIR
jgi:hypothetical protein